MAEYDGKYDIMPHIATKRGELKMQKKINIRQILMRQLLVKTSHNCHISGLFGCRYKYIIEVMAPPHNQIYNAIELTVGKCQL